MRDAIRPAPYAPKPRRARLVVMVKEPVAGRVKTRLGRGIGMTAAAWWFRHQTRALIRRLDQPFWDLELAVSPDVAGLRSRVWPRHLARHAQGHGDLGTRMKRQILRRPHGPVMIIGADIPAISAAHIRDGIKGLGQRPAVIGPAPDGGFWLIGFRRTSALPASLFHGARWSSVHARTDTITSLGGMPVAEIATLRDVDEATDLRQRSR